MNTRGNLPGTLQKLRKSQLPTSTAALIDPPAELTGKALSFWNAHAAALAQADCLSPQDVPAFVIVCGLWERLQSPDLSNREYLDLSARFLQYGKHFSLTPSARKKEATSFSGGRYEDRDAFEF